MVWAHAVTAPLNPPPPPLPPFSYSAHPNLFHIPHPYLFSSLIAHPLFAPFRFSPPSSPPLSFPPSLQMSDLLKHRLYHAQGGGASLGQPPPVPFEQVGVSRAAQQGSQSAPQSDSAYSRGLGASGGQYMQQPGSQTTFRGGRGGVEWGGVLGES